jgi:hypothetical protein
VCAIDHHPKTQPIATSAKMASLFRTEKSITRSITFNASTHAAHSACLRRKVLSCGLVEGRLPKSPAMAAGYQFMG